jgi:hypothetical protein
VPLLRQLERASSEGDLNPAPELLKAIHQEFARIKAFFQSQPKSIAA